MEAGLLSRPSLERSTNPDRLFSDAELNWLLKAEFRNDLKRLFTETPSPARPPALPRAFCASGRECRSHGRDKARVKTHLKCRGCNLVACCNKCRTCANCPPL